VKNFWLARRRKKEFAQRINMVNGIIQGAINHRLQKLKMVAKGKIGWQQKKDTKTP
jgi:hypothetical protein